MRKNLPVLNEEIKLDPRRPIVTKTDLKGKITYANRSFINISSFSRDELIGQPHNIVRHPDMPPSAFQDLWQTVHANLPWKGVVKNRTKDGKYYWVSAHVSPLFERGEKIGYISVRSTPTSKQIKEAEDLYQAVNANRATLPATPIHQGFSLNRYMSLMLLPSLIGISSLFFVRPNLTAPIAGTILIWLLISHFVVHKKITAPLSSAHHAIKQLSEGNFHFDISAHGTSEFQTLIADIESLKVNFRAIIADVFCSSESVKDDSNKLKTQAADLRALAHNNIDGIQSVASALEELSTSVNEIAEATQRSSEHAQTAQSIVDESSERVESSLVTIGKVVQVVDTAKKQMDDLQQSTHEISQLTLTIKEIADQTNLLALNAAIEAARAGEFGRGFAVVADEVRKLAERTTQSTEEIRQTIKNIEVGSMQAIHIMQEVVGAVAQSTEKIQQSRDSLNQITEATVGITTSSTDIANMLAQQSQATEEVARNMERMSGLIQSSYHAVAEVSQSSEDLSELASELNGLVHHFEKSL